jgi:8-oxo-dGTP diphosphatase
MRTIQRDIVGGFIFSKDGKLLLGKSIKGGVYEGSYSVPGGGIEESETKEQALAREMLEETGIDVNRGRIAEISSSTGGHEKTLRGTNERVFVDMVFYNYKIELPQVAIEIIVRAEDDWTSPRWFTPAEISEANIAEPTLKKLQEIGFVVTQ